MKLYYSPSACSLAPHIVLRELDISFELVKVDLQKKVTEHGEDYLKINPKGYVPALLLDDRTLLTEVAIILQYLSDQKPSIGLMPAHGTQERYQLLEWLNFIATEIHKGFGPLFHKTTPPAYIEIAKNILTKRLQLLSNQISDKRYITGDLFTIADAYLFTVLRWTHFVNFNMDAWPNLVAFSNRVAKRPTVQAALSAEKKDKPLQ